jgi:hypothetical protein
MLYAEMKKIICHGLEWSYDDVSVEITLRCQIGKHQYYPVLIVCNGNFETIDSFTQNDLNMKVLYVSC